MMSKRYTKVMLVPFVAVVTGLGGLPAVAAQQVERQSSTSSSPNEVTGQALTTATATVEAVDQKNRTVTLKGPQGNVFEVAVGDEVKNLSQVKEGDQVTVKYYETLTLSLQQGAGGQPGSSAQSSQFSAEPGRKPAGARARTVTITADVTSINKQDNTVTLKGPHRTVELPVKDPNLLNKLKVGDQVTATYTEALAVAVEPAAGQ